MASNNQNIEALLGMIRGEISGIHTSCPGTIVSYNSGTGQASVQPALKFKVTNSDSITAPVITNVPVYFPSGANSQITYPITAGDSCWLVFAERSIDDWLLGGESDDPRKYDLTDCAAFVGMKPTRSTNNDVVEIRNGSNYITIKENGGINVKSGTNTLDISDNGNIVFTGNLIVHGDVTINDISFLNHVHGGVESGGSTTSTPEGGD